MQTNKSAEKTKQTQEEYLTAEELQETRKLIKVLLLAWRNYTIYPEGHAASSKSLLTLENSFNEYFSRLDDLRLKIEKKRLFCGPDIIHEISPNAPTEDIVFLLYRDGMQWIEFEKGITREELAYFFKIISKYRVLVEDTEGDIITGLFEGELNHIKYEAADIFWKDEQLLDFSSLNESFDIGSLHDTGEYSYDIDDEKESLVEEPEESKSKSIADLLEGESLWEISSDEYNKLQTMVLEEENWDSTEDIFDVLLVILRSQTDKNNFSTILDYTLEEVVETIEQEEFGLLINLFQSLQQLRYRDESEEMIWVRPLIDRFFHDLSTPEIFESISKKLLAFNDSNADKIYTMRQVLLYFSPSIIISLGPILARTQSEQVKKMILGVIEYLSLKDLGPLEELLNKSGKELGEKLLTVLRGLKGTRSNAIFFTMTKHPSDRLRREAVSILLARDKSYAPKLFPLINDPSPEVRKNVISGIGNYKSSVMENMLIKFIKESPDIKDEAQILSCYEALGKCGSVVALPFLKRILFNKSWNRFRGFGKLVHREGAATALALMDSWEAHDVLKKASKSRNTAIREAYKRAMATLDASGGDTDG